ncbi:MAG: PEP-CTERM sorting domain-containing protein [Planctomycetota bacterium]
MNKTLTAAPIALVLMAPLAEAELVDFVVDPTKSSIDITSTSGVIFEFVGGELISTPAPGSATAPGGFSADYKGTLRADLSGGEIQFIGVPGSLMAIDAGSFLPGIPLSPGDLPNNVTPAPAAYAVTYAGLFFGGPLQVATREFTLNVSSGSGSTLTPGGGGVSTFDVAGIVFDPDGGEGHLNEGAGGAIVPLDVPDVSSGVNATGVGQLQEVDGLLELTLPVEYTIVVNSILGPITQNYQGTIVAVQIPEPSSLAMCVVGVLAASWRGRRRRGVGTA